MDFINSVIKMTLKRIKNTPFTVLFLIMGLTLSMLVISISVSFVTEIVVAAEEKEKAHPPNGKQYCVLWHNEEIEKNINIENFFEEIDKGTGIIINGLMVHIDETEINTFAPMSGEWFVDDSGWHYPVVEGRYYTAEEVLNGEKVVLIGKNYKECIYKENGREYIDIESEQYEVIGVVGLGEEASFWDARVFMPCTSLPQGIKEKCVESGGFGFIIYNEDVDILNDDLEQIKSNADKVCETSDVSYVGELEVEEISRAIASEMIIIIAILGYIAIIVYAVNILIFWIEKRKREIAIRKAVGYKERDIIKLLIAEMVGLSSISCALAIIIQSILKIFMDDIAGYNLRIYASNLIVGVVVVCVTAIVTSILPIWKMAKVHPIETLRKG